MLIKVFCHTTHFHHLTNTVLMCYVCCSRSCILLYFYTISPTQFWYGMVALQGSLLCCAPSSFHQHTLSCLTSPTIILVIETGLCDVCIRHMKSKNEKYRCLYNHPKTYLSFINEYQSVKHFWWREGWKKLPLHTVSFALILCSWSCAIFIVVSQLSKLWISHKSLVKPN